MTNAFDRYQSPDAPVADETHTWNMYGPGLENVGRNGKPECESVPEPSDDQLLVRVDAVGMCFSDVKLIQQGGQHPKMYNRDLSTEPTRLGHEAALTVLRVGQNLRDTYSPGQRLAMQPDIYQNGKSTAYGYTIPGGLIQFHLIGSEVLNADDGSYILTVGEGLGYAETALTEPWACVEGAYTQRRRLTPQVGGTMWIVGQPGDTTEYTFSQFLDAPTTIVLTDVPTQLCTLIEHESNAQITMRDGLRPADYTMLKDELADGRGFDDIVVLDPHSAEMVSAAAKLIARRGTFNLVGQTRLDGEPQIDVGRLHYDYTAYVGTNDTDIAASYGETRNRAELCQDGVAVFIGAGGPMGQMHVQRAVELNNGPRTIIATDVNDERLVALDRMFATLAKERGKRLVIVNTSQPGNSLHEVVMHETDGRGVDDVIVSVPSAALMAEAGSVMGPNGMLVLFAGVPIGTYAPLNVSDVYLHNAQFTGTSGSRLSDQQLVIQKIVTRELSPNRSVAAVGGIEAAQDGLRAMMEGHYPGKIVIFPQISGLPLIGLPELKDCFPDVAAKLGHGDVWTPEAEKALIEQFWKP